MAEPVAVAYVSIEIDQAKLNRDLAKTHAKLGQFSAKANQKMLRDFRALTSSLTRVGNQLATILRRTIGFAIAGITIAGKQFFKQMDRDPRTGKRLPKGVQYEYASAADAREQFGQKWAKISYELAKIFAQLLKLPVFGRTAFEWLDWLQKRLSQLKTSDLKRFVSALEKIIKLFVSVSILNGLGKFASSLASIANNISKFGGVPRGSPGGNYGAPPLAYNPFGNKDQTGKDADDLLQDRRENKKFYQNFYDIRKKKGLNPYPLFQRNTPKPPLPITPMKQNAVFRSAGAGVAGSAIAGAGMMAASSLPKIIGGGLMALGKFTAVTLALTLAIQAGWWALDKYVFKTKEKEQAEEDAAKAIDKANAREEKLQLTRETMGNLIKEHFSALEAYKNIGESIAGKRRDIEDIRSSKLGYSGQFSSVTDAVKLAQQTQIDWNAKMIEDNKKLVEINAEILKESMEQKSIMRDVLNIFKIQKQVAGGALAN